MNEQFGLVYDPQGRLKQVSGGFKAGDCKSYFEQLKKRLMAMPTSA